MTHKRTKKMRCPTCDFEPQSVAKYCHECKGRRFIEYPIGVCDGEELFDPATGGWECNKCGGGGPW